MSVITARRGCRSLSGVMTESMMRDEGYAFLEVGRLLERSILTVELLKSGLGTGSDVFDGNRLLAFTHSLQAARREIGHSPSWDAAARFLLQHETLPRSVLWCLGRVSSASMISRRRPVRSRHRGGGLAPCERTSNTENSTRLWRTSLKPSFPGWAAALATLAADVHASHSCRFRLGTSAFPVRPPRPRRAALADPTGPETFRTPKPQDDRS